MPRVFPSRRRWSPALAVVLVAACAAAGILAARGFAQDARPVLLVVSIDGLRPDYILAADTYQARVPHMRRFLREGAFADGVEGVIPTVTYPSHTTLVTGVWPATHGIFANATFDPRRENQDGYYWYAEDIRVPTLWDAAREAGLTAASIQWPVTVGARIAWNIPEIWRANTPDDAKLLRAVSTPGLLAELEPELGRYPRGLDVEADELRARYAIRILEAKRPALLMLHLIALDQKQHEVGPGTSEVIAVLERLDAVVGTLRAAAERAAPGRAFLAIVSDHGFARTDAQINLFAAFRAAGLFAEGAGRVTAWKALPWAAGGSAAIVLHDPSDATTRAEVRQVLTDLARDPANGIDRILEADAVHQRGGFPTASFLVGLKPGWRIDVRTNGPVRSTYRANGTHGHLPDLPELRASFFLVGPGVPAGRSLGTMDMRDVAPTLARRLGLALPAADGRSALP
jgi:predicted AlkP superfamily pyrophosphatase or phosphodiesterase